MSAAQHLTVGTDCCFSVAGRCASTRPIWLLQKCVGWIACQLDSPSSVRTECSRTAHFQDTDAPSTLLMQSSASTSFASKIVLMT